MELKRLPKTTYLCWRYPFLKLYLDKDKFFCTWCYYYAIPSGWRKAFGLQMLEEIRRSLIRTGGKKALKSMSIQDVKEKFGSLQIYCSATPEVYKIIQKYEYISSHTCINCGKPATVITTGWICPYCNDCVGDKYCVHFGHKYGMFWYGWTGNIDYIPKEQWEKEEKFLNEFYENNNSTGCKEASS